MEYVNSPADRGNWMQTASGQKYFPMDPRAEEVKIEDIAAALSKVCRFGGHCNKFYSVAEHSVYVSMFVPKEWALQGLLHDATEAYLADIVRPVKGYLTGYKEIEDRNWRVIAEKFGVPYDLHSSVKEADNNVLLTEQKYLMAESPGDWCVPGKALPFKPVALSPDEAYTSFMTAFKFHTETT
jgi:hypothetical protein